MAANIVLKCGTGVSSITYAWVSSSGTRTPSSGTKTTTGSVTMNACDHVWISSVTASSGYTSPYKIDGTSFTSNYTYYPSVGGTKNVIATAIPTSKCTIYCRPYQGGGVSSFKLSVNGVKTRAISSATSVEVDQGDSVYVTDVSPSSGYTSPYYYYYADSSYSTNNYDSINNSIYTSRAKRYIQPFATERTTYTTHYVYIKSNNVTATITYQDMYGQTQQLTLSNNGYWGFYARSGSGSYCSVTNISSASGYTTPITWKYNTSSGGTGTRNIPEGGSNTVDTTYDRDITITATQEPQKMYYYLYFNANGGTGGPSTQSKYDYEGGTTMTIPSTKPTRTNYRFLGWSKSQTASSASYDPGDSVSVDDELVLYAVWEGRVNYKVTYDYNGGTYGGSSGPYVDSESRFDTWYDMPVTGITPTKTNYRFLGWASLPTETVPEYTQGETIQLNSTYPTRYLYAVYAKSNLTLTCVYKDGSGTKLRNDYTTTIAFGSRVNSSTYAFDITGYTFYRAEPEVIDSMERDTTITYIYTIKSYTATYNPNGGTGSISPTYKYHGNSATFSDGSGFSMAGHRLLSWNTRGDGLGDSYELGGIWSRNENYDLYLYAIWDEITCTLTCRYKDTGGGTLRSDYSDRVAIGSNINSSDYAFDITGYTFTAAYPASITNIREDSTIDLIYSINTYTISYDANGGSGSISSTTKIHDRTVALSDGTGFSKTKYTLDSWNTKADGTGTSYALGSNIPANQNYDQTLYAIWRKSHIISHFTWTTNDAAKITVGQPITNIKATAWNNMEAKIHEVEDELEWSHTSLSTVDRGETIKATLFNQMRNAIAQLPNSGTVPSIKNQGTSIKAEYFNGSGSLKNALNNAIDSINNS